MKIVCVGGGPAGLYFAILTKKREPHSQVVVYERNKPDDTFGFGVVFSDKTLENLGQIDAESYAAITGSFFHWDDIDVHFKGEVIKSRGHGFSGLSRLTLLQILQRRATELGVEIHYEKPIEPGAPELIGADLVVLCDGVNSAFRSAFKASFQPEIDLRPARFLWLGTTFPFEAFTFYFKNNAAGLFQVHAYRYEEGKSTFIVECSEDAFQKSGLKEDDGEGAARYFEELFKGELGGHPLLTNRSFWRRFPAIRCKSWRHDNGGQPMVLLGDAVHTAHFSIGSGTKLALEDAIALRTALDEPGPIEERLAAYEAAHRPYVESIQRAAQVSLEWFETTERHVKKAPLHFALALLTRSLRVTHENLRLRDPRFVDSVDRDLEAEVARELPGGVLPPRPDRRSEPRPPMFLPLRLRDLVIDNRVGLSPMCMYSATDGAVNDFHLVHLGSRAIGGAGLIMAEMTDVSADGRITPGCAGIWDGSHATAWKRITSFVHGQSRAKIGLQIGHAGRKGSVVPPWQGQDVPLKDGVWGLIGPSALPWSAENPVPTPMDRAAMDRVKADFVNSAHLALEAGFDLIELHCAHGYLLSTFLSPLTNHRDDAYGGSVENRARFPLEVFRAMRAVWPAERPMSVRLSASDWADGGISEADLVATAKLFREAGADLIDVSSGSNVPHQKPRYGRLYQVPFAELVRSETGAKVAAVGNISSYTDVNTIIAARRADLCLIARAHLFDPYWVRHAAQAQGYELEWPAPYGLMRTYSPRFA